MSPSKLSRQGKKKSKNVGNEKLPDFKGTEFGRRISEEMKENEKVSFFCNLITFFLQKRVLEPFKNSFYKVERDSARRSTSC
jgi:hypothetical protein